MNKLFDINYIKSLLARYGFNFSKGLGQNFIVDGSICPRMAEESVVNDNIGVIEIGPGIGVLTRELAKRAKKVISIEIDNRLLTILDETMKEFSNVKIINGDFLNIDVASLLKEEFEGMDVSICANLPYYITSPIIMKILESKLDIKSIVAMVQKEAADRLCAKPGSRECGAVSVAVRYYSNPEILFNVPRTSFIPQPEVDSSVIKLNIHKDNILPDKIEKTLFHIVKSSFSQRRKTIINSLNGTCGKSKIEIERICELLNINPKSRAENLTLENFIKLTKHMVN